MNQNTKTMISSSSSSVEKIKANNPKKWGVITKRFKRQCVAYVPFCIFVVVVVSFPVTVVATHWWYGSFSILGREWWWLSLYLFFLLSLFLFLSFFLLLFVVFSLCSSQHSSSNILMDSRSPKPWQSNIMLFF